MQCACLEQKWGAELLWGFCAGEGRVKLHFGHGEFEVSQELLQTDPQQVVGEEYIRGTSAMRQMQKMPASPDLDQKKVDWEERRGTDVTGEQRSPLRQAGEAR